MAKTNLILLHGALGSAKGLEQLSALLSEEFHVYAPDLEGHGGQSSDREFRIENFASALLGYLHAENISKADFFGYSMGGYVALYLASIAPDKVGNIMTLGTKFAWTPQTAAEELKKLDPEKIEAKAPQFARHLESQHTAQDWKVVVGRTAGLMKDLGDHPLLRSLVLKQIPHRVCIVLGDSDTMVSREESEKAALDLPQGAFVILPNTPHPLEQVDPLSLKKLIQDFLNNSLLEKDLQRAHYCSLVREYIEAYNSFQPERMVVHMHPEVIFENKYKGATDTRLEGKAAFLEQAKKAASYFSGRKQEILEWSFEEEDSVKITIAYEAIMAVDFPNGLKKGDRLQIKGSSTFRFKDGLIGYLLDENA
jgi:pimeloyl-ACP methyl ester carboxylesterase